MHGWKLRPSGAQCQGRAWHSALEHNYIQKVRSRVDLPLDEVTDFYAGALEEELSDADRRFDGELLDQGVKLVRVHHEEVAPKVKPALVEQEFRVSLGESFPYDLLGIIDLVERDRTIVDNKSYKRSPNQADLDKDIQFTAYSLGYRLEHGGFESGLRMDAVVKNKKPKVVQLKTYRSNDECRWFLDLVENVVAAIQSGLFFPNPNGWHCSPTQCGYWSDCKARRSV